MKSYHPAKLFGHTFFVHNREAILERIQVLIRKGLATSIDGTRFRTNLDENRLRRTISPPGGSRPS